MTARERLPNRRASETFEFECNGLHYTATFSRFADGRIGELFLNNHKSNSGADVAASDAAIATNIAIQFGADIETIRKALCRDSHGRASGPLGAALDLIAEGGVVIADILAFPPRGPFAVRILREDEAWLVVCRENGWLHGDRNAALHDARAIAHSFGVGVTEAQP